ncbi:cell wall protein [Streptomyces sp. NPDC001492]
MYGAAQEVAHTASRWSAPRKWLAAVRWLIGAGLHPRANATTQRVADDLAARMDYSTGHVRYCEAEMVTRTGISRANLYRHVGYLRELGALAYVQHGSRKNVRAAMGLKGYAATATEYAAVIPAAYDDAMGHRIVGAGYSARIVIDMRDCKTSPKAAPKDPVDTPGNPAVDNSGSSGLETPSLTWVEEDGKLKMVGGSNYTSRKTASRDRASIPQQRSNSSNGSSKSGRHALQVAQDIRIAAQVRPLVNWTQRVPLRPLAYCLRPLIDRGLDAYGIAAYLNGLCTGERWRPKRPAAYIRAVLADRQQADHKRAQAVERYELENPAEGAFRATIGQQQSFLAAHKAGLAKLHRNATANGWADLAREAEAAHTDADAAADFAAFLGTNTVLAPAF